MSKLDMSPVLDLIQTEIDETRLRIQTDFDSALYETKRGMRPVFVDSIEQCAETVLDKIERTPELAAFVKENEITTDRVSALVHSYFPKWESVVAPCLAKNFGIPDMAPVVIEVNPRLERSDDDLSS